MLLLGGDTWPLLEDWAGITEEASFLELVGEFKMELDKQMHFKMY